MKLFFLTVSAVLVLVIGLWMSFIHKDTHYIEDFQEVSSTNKITINSHSDISHEQENLLKFKKRVFNKKPLNLKIMNTIIPQSSQILDDVAKIYEKIYEVGLDPRCERHDYNGSTWFRLENKEEKKTWNINLLPNDIKISSAKQRVYKDRINGVLDESKSFRIAFSPIDSSLQHFQWSDGRELIFVDEQSQYINYGKRLHDKVFLEMLFDNHGNLISSNVWDWAKRGRVIKK